MKQIEKSDLIKVIYSMYDGHFDGYITNDTELIDGATDDDWNLLPEYSDCVWIEIEGAYGSSFLVHEDDIINVCWKEPRLASGWGWKNPADPVGTDDCGQEPDYYFEDDDGETVYLF